jgi:hypothetical protein
VLSLYDGEDMRITYVDQARANGARNAEVNLRIESASAVSSASARAKP